VLSISDVTAEHWAEIAKDDAVAASLLRYGVPLTRENYLSLAYGSEVPEGDDWGPELDGGLPWPLRRGAFDDQVDAAERLGLDLG
jgi:hypothetical protein